MDKNKEMYEFDYAIRALEMKIEYHRNDLKLLDRYKGIAMYEEIKKEILESLGKYEVLKCLAKISSTYEQWAEWKTNEKEKSKN